VAFSKNKRKPHQKRPFLKKAVPKMTSFTFLKIATPKTPLFQK